MREFAILALMVCLGSDAAFFVQSLRNYQYGESTPVTIRAMHSQYLHVEQSALSVSLGRQDAFLVPLAKECMYIDS